MLSRVRLHMVVGAVSYYVIMSCVLLPASNPLTHAFPQPDGGTPHRYVHTASSPRQLPSPVPFLLPSPTRPETCSPRPFPRQPDGGTLHRGSADQLLTELCERQGVMLRERLVLRGGWVIGACGRRRERACRTRLVTCRGHHPSPCLRLPHLSLWRRGGGPPSAVARNHPAANRLVTASATATAAAAAAVRA